MVICCNTTTPFGKSKGSARTVSSIGRSRNKQGKRSGSDFEQRKRNKILAKPVQTGTRMAGLKAEPSRQVVLRRIFSTSVKKKSWHTNVENSVLLLCFLSAVIVVLVVGKRGSSSRKSSSFTAPVGECCCKFLNLQQFSTIYFLKVPQNFI